jgi:8-oxo-dGTP pyrophosphatase MutT (NUDIX family)
VPAGKYEGEADRGCYHKCALRETQEEAGVQCEVLYDLGWFARPAQQRNKRSTRTRFFAMRCLAEDDMWLEENERRRQWQPLKKAQALIQHNDMLAKVFQQLEAVLPEINMDEGASTASETSLKADTLSSAS